MNLDNTNPRGATIFAYDDVLRVLAVQWKDSRVVGAITFVVDTTVGTIERQIGSHRQTFPCPTVLQQYQQNMFGVDKGDQLRAAGGGFAKKPHFKKW